MAIDIEDSAGVPWVDTALIGAQAAYLLDRYVMNRGRKVADSH